MESIEDHVVPGTVATFDQSSFDAIDPRELGALIEALLLAAPAPTTVAELASGAGTTADAIEAAIDRLERESDRGWVIQRHGASVQLATAPRFSSYVRRFLRIDREARLSSAALESLAIIAYQQPITKSEIEAVRGVDCSGVLSTLLTRGLIDQVGRRASPGNPIQYASTAEFLRHFGLTSLADLPPLGAVDGRDASIALEAAVAAVEPDRQRISGEGADD